MKETQMELQLKTSLFRDLWHEFCQKHTELYEVTCEEYSHLLASDIDKLESTIEEKQNIINFINKLEVNRNEVASEISNLIQVEKPEKLTYMLDSLRKNNLEKQASEIEKLNLVLLDIIEKIQEQNKRNQIFLNKAIISLKELRQSFSGKESYNTYSPSGMTRRV